MVDGVKKGRVVVGVQELAVKQGVLVGVLCLALVGVFSARGLYADGAYFLFNILVGQSYWDFDWPRAFGHFA